MSGGQLHQQSSRYNRWDKACEGAGVTQGNGGSEADLALRDAESQPRIITKFHSMPLPKSVPSINKASGSKLKMEKATAIEKKTHCYFKNAHLK